MAQVHTNRFRSPVQVFLPSSVIDVDTLMVETRERIDASGLRSARLDPSIKQKHMPQTRQEHDIQHL